MSYHDVSSHAMIYNGTPTIHAPHVHMKARGRGELGAPSFGASLAESPIYKTKSKVCSRISYRYRGRMAKMHAILWVVGGNRARVLKPPNCFSVVDV